MTLIYFEKSARAIVWLCNSLFEAARKVSMISIKGPL